MAILILIMVFYVVALLSVMSTVCIAWLYSYKSTGHANNCCSKLHSVIYVAFHAK
jgi:hypothetical protein